MTVYIVAKVRDKYLDPYEIKVFTDAAKAIKYFRAMNKMEDPYTIFAEETEE